MQLSLLGTFLFFVTRSCSPLTLLHLSQSLTQAWLLVQLFKLQYLASLFLHT